MTTYALINSENEIVNVKRGLNFKPSDKWTKVIYPIIDKKYKTPEYSITQTPFSQWTIDENNNVIVTYDIKKLNFNEILHEKMKKLSEVRDLVVNAGIEIEINDKTYPINTNENEREILHDLISNIKKKPNDWFINLKLADESTLKIDKDILKYISMKIENHIKICFKYEQIKKEELKSKRNIKKLNSVKIYEGWPLTYFNVKGLNNQQNLDFIL